MHFTIRTISSAYILFGALYETDMYPVACLVASFGSEMSII